MWIKGRSVASVVAPVSTVGVFVAVPVSGVPVLVDVAEAVPVTPGSPGVALAREVAAVVGGSVGVVGIPSVSLLVMQGLRVVN